MIFDTPIRIGELDISNRLVMPPMQTNKTDRGHVTAELVQYYRDRAVYSRPGIIITEHSCIAESGRAAEGQLSIASMRTLKSTGSSPMRSTQAGARLLYNSTTPAATGSANRSRQVR